MKRAPGLVPVGVVFEDGVGAGDDRAEGGVGSTNVEQDPACAEALRGAEDAGTVAAAGVHRLGEVGVMFEADLVGVEPSAVGHGSLL